MAPMKFRKGDYGRYVRIGKRTIKAGEAAVIWNSYGTSRLVVGPSLQRMWWSYIRFLDKFRATGNQYLVVHYRDGRTEHVRGPVQLFQNPVVHEKIEVRDAVHLKSSKQALVIFKSTHKTAAAAEDADEDADVGKGKAMHVLPVRRPRKTGELLSSERKTDEGEKNQTRRVERGPQLFFPAPDEILHQFAWSGGIVNSEILPLDTMPLHLEMPVRTGGGDVAVTCSFDLNLRVARVLQALESSSDPVARIKSALAADLASFGGQLKASELANKEQLEAVRLALSRREALPDTCKVVADSGLALESVRIVKTSASKALSRSFDALSLRKADLVSKAARAEQTIRLAERKKNGERKQAEEELAAATAIAQRKKDLADLELQNAVALAERKRRLAELELQAQRAHAGEAHKLKQAALEHEMEIAAAKQRAQMALEAEKQAKQIELREARHRAELVWQQKQSGAELKKQQAQNEQVAGLLRELAKDGLDITKFLCCPAGQEAKGLILAAPALTSRGQQTTDAADGPFGAFGTAAAAPALA